MFGMLFDPQQVEYVEEISREGGFTILLLVLFHS